MDISKLLSALLPIGEELASIFIHNPASQAKFSMIVGTVNELEPAFAALIPTASATAAAPVAAAAEPIIPAGVPSAH